MKIPNEIILILILCLAPVMTSAQENGLKVPGEVKPFVEKDMKAIELQSADLNGDGAKDYVLVLEKAKVAPEDEYTEESDRPLLILTRGLKDGKLSLVARNDDVVYCRNCGGVYGDPFAGVIAGHNTFTVQNVGGSSDRWIENYRFSYSQSDKTWQLVRAVFTYYNVFRPKLGKTRILAPPKDFGKVSLSGFNLGIFQKKSAK